MTANAIANHVSRKVLLANFPTLSKEKTDELLRLVFREAKIQNAIIFGRFFL